MNELCSTADCTRSSFIYEFIHKKYSCYVSVVANADRERGSMWDESSACAERLGAELWRLASKYSLVHYLYSTAAVIREEIPLLRNPATEKLRLEPETAGRATRIS